MSRASKPSAARTRQRCVIPGAELNLGRMRRRGRRRTEPAEVRRFLATAVIALWAFVCLGALIAPNSVLFDQLLPFIASPVTLVLGYYFGRTTHE